MYIKNMIKLTVFAALLCSGAFVLHCAADEWELVGTENEIEKSKKNILYKFFSAAQSGDVNTVKLILQSEGDVVNSQYKQAINAVATNLDHERLDCTPLMFAVIAQPLPGAVDFWGYRGDRTAKYKEIVKLLLEKGADPSFGSYSTFHPYTGVKVEVDSGAIGLTDLILDGLKQRRLYQSKTEAQNKAFDEQIAYYTDILYLLNPSFGTRAVKCVAGAAGCVSGAAVGCVEGAFGCVTGAVGRIRGKK